MNALNLYFFVLNMNFVFCILCFVLKLTEYSNSIYLKMKFNIICKSSSFLTCFVDICDPAVWCSEVNPNVTVLPEQVAIKAATFLVAILQDFSGILSS